MKPRILKLITVPTITALWLGAASSLHADDHATDARLRALEHELNLLRGELASERAARTQRATDFVAGEDLPPLPALDPIDDDAIFVQPKQSAVTELKIRGRMHYQFGYSSVDESGYSDYSTHEFRRMRLGASGKLLDDWKFELIADILPDSSSSRLDSAYIQYVGWDGLTLSFEKTRPQLGHELTTSSASIKTVERSNLSNLVDPKKITGVSLSGEMGLLSWQVASYNGELGTNQESTALGNEGVPEYAVNASVGLDLSEVVGLDRFALRLDYIYNSDDDDEGGIAIDSYEDIIAASLDLGVGGFSFSAEYIQADLHDGGELSGFYVMPSVMLSEKLEAVLRYEWVESEDGASIRHQSRYARNNVASHPGVSSLSSIRGEEYWALYGGFNYYINKSVKLMFGAEYAELDDIIGGGNSVDAITGYGAVRLEF